MIKIALCIRKPGGNEVIDWMLINVPQVPAVGDYISVSSLDVREPLSEDLIVRKVWWRLQRVDGDEQVGSFTEVQVECDVALGPYATQEWQRMVINERRRGNQIENFDVSRITVGLGNYVSEDEP